MLVTLHVGVCCAIVSVPYSLVVTSWERADLLAVLSLSKMCMGPNQNLGRSWRRETGLGPPVKYFTDRYKAVLLLWIFFCLVFAMPLCASVYMCLVVTYRERADLLALVLRCPTVSLSLSPWYPGSCVVLDCIDS